MLSGNGLRPSVFINAQGSGLRPSVLLAQGSGRNLLRPPVPRRNGLLDLSGVVLSGQLDLLSALRRVDKSLSTDQEVMFRHPVRRASCAS